MLRHIITTVHFRRCAAAVPGRVGSRPPLPGRDHTRRDHARLSAKIARASARGANRQRAIRPELASSTMRRSLRRASGLVLFADMAAHLVTAIIFAAQVNGKIAQGPTSPARRIVQKSEEVGLDSSVGGTRRDHYRFFPGRCSAR